MRIVCRTYFDITATGVTGHYKSAQVPFLDRAGQTIQNEISWNLARNQQRNWETLTQVVSLRTQIYQLAEPIRVMNMFEFSFEVETPGALGPDTNPTELLLSDADGVPMLPELWNIRDIDPVLTVSGPRQNIWFSVAA